MKKGYIRLLVFELIIFIVLFINSFVSSILGNYTFILFLLIIVAIFKFLFNFEKDRHRFMKDILFEVIIFLFSFFILFYLSGIIISFAKIDNYYTLYDFIHTILPIILSIIIKEFLRYQMLTKSEGSKLLIIVTTMLFFFMDISLTLLNNLHLSVYDTFVYISLNVLPAISLNIVASYVAIKVGYKPMIVYRLVMELYLYLIPLVPNPNEYILSVIRLFLPFLLGLRIYKFFLKDRDEEVPRERKKRRVTSLLLPTLVVAFLVYFTSGYFRFYAVAIASGSMVPMINKGDMVIVDQIRGDYSKLAEGQVIAYRKDNIIIVHRLVQIMQVGDETFYYTKGDANNDRDNWVVNQDMIMGIVNIKVPYIGYPTILINEL